jgi:predicted nucleic acid-binding Zn ribbon protein
VDGAQKGYRRRERARQLSELLPAFLSQIGGNFQSRGDELLTAWPEVIGPQLAPMTKVAGYAEGVLTVTVAHSTLLGLLRQEKMRLIQKLKERCPGAPLSEIRLRLG